MKHNRKKSTTQHAKTSLLDALIDAGSVFFWREYDEPYGFLCQWWLSPFTDPDVHSTHVFNCAEQYMMYHKALLLATPGPFSASVVGQSRRRTEMRDVASALPARVLAAISPAEQKYMISSYLNLVREQSRGLDAADKALMNTYLQTFHKTWETQKLDVVRRGSYCK